MITEVVLFDLPDGMTREQVIADMRAGTAHWRAAPDLIRKVYLYDPDNGQAGGVYLWKSREAAQRAHDEVWRRRIMQVYGSKPSIRYFETPLVVDNALHQVVEALAA